LFSLRREQDKLQSLREGLFIPSKHLMDGYKMKKKSEHLRLEVLSL